MVQVAKRRLILLLLPEWADTEKFGRVTEWESAEWQMYARSYIEFLLSLPHESYGKLRNHTSSLFCTSFLSHANET